ncbi:MAG: insulinase family protein, partial [Clostridiales bacterium]|nr:insulinase family protein [Clostridiales bacterium]
LFKGTENRTAKEIADDIDEVGGQINAYTTKEFTCYYTRTLDTHFDVALDVLADMFFRSKFDDLDIKKERNVILEEINMYEDTPEDLVHDLLQYTVWRDDPLGYSILGTRESIARFDHAYFRNYFRENYYPDKTVLTVVGHFDPDAIIRKIEQYFNGYLNPEEAPAPCCRVDALYHPCVVTKNKEIEQVHLCVGFPSIALGDQRSYDLTTMNTIFGGGMSSRLFQTIREEHGLAYSVYSYPVGFTDTGIFTIYAGLNPTQAEDVLILIFNEIRQFFTDKITEAQLRKTKEQMKSNFLLGMESTNSRMSGLGRSQVLLGRTFTARQIIEKIDAVTLDSLYTLAAHVLQTEQASLSAVGNIGEMDFEEIMKRVRVS